ncbi:MAG TPA: hypothetical protein VFB95_12565 [Candidatus Cryosericum sp.]|nr:hypothetical protein [Candidatus Cryosericum sp.]
MPIEYRIDHASHRVLAEGYGKVTDEDVFVYQREVWSRSDVQGYDELVDMSDATTIEEGSSDRMRELAALSAAADPPQGSSRFAIVAPGDLAFGVGRMYQAYRQLNDRTTKQVAVFREREAAIRWLDGEEPAPGDSIPAPPRRDPPT